jgi:hypothetical protein
MQISIAHPVWRIGRRLKEDVRAEEIGRADDDATGGGPR